MAEVKNKTLWMRPVEWEIILKLLEIVYRDNGKLRPIELENIALKEGAFKSKTTGAQLAHSPRFYYRKALEHLGLVNSVSGRYSISNNPAVLELISNGTEIDSCKKQTLAELIVANEDCRKQFISLFALDGLDLGALQKRSTYVVAKSYTAEYKSTTAKRSLKPIMLASPVINKTILADTPDRIHAIFWGIRRWLLDVDVIDEIITSPKKGRFIYFINPFIDENRLALSIKSFLQKSFNSSGGEWTTIYLPDFYEHIIFNSELRAGTLTIKKFLINFINKNKSFVVPIPISGTMLNAEIKFEKQDNAFKRSFLNFQNLGYVAHLHINKALI